jgi:hypothetical protein
MLYILKALLWVFLLAPYAVFGLIYLDSILDHSLTTEERQNYTKGYLWALALLTMNNLSVWQLIKG